MKLGTFLPLCAGLVAASLAGGSCAASRAEVREAENSGYATDFAVVYSEVLAVVRKLYPGLSENASAGVIKTSWHEVRIAQGDQDPPRSSNNVQPGLMNPNRRAAKLHFVRFTVRILGGDPWRVSIEGQASEWDRATASPYELTGSETPPWLTGRTNALRVAIHDRLASYAVKLPDTSLPVAAKDGPRTGDVPAPAADASKLDNLPPGAAKAVRAALAACKSRDFVALRATMSDQLVWSLGAEPGADQAVVIWQADTSMLEQLASAIEAGCRTDKSGQQVTCPPAYTEDSEYLGYRVGFELGKDGAWRMSFFVNGD